MMTAMPGVFAGGDLVRKLQHRPIARGEPRSGTRVRCWPDPKYFDSAAIPSGELVQLLRSKAVLLPGLKVTLVEEKSGRTQSWRYDEGLRGYLSESLAQLSDSPPIIPLFEGDQSVGHGHESFAEGEGAQWVVAWTEEGPLLRESYVNLIPTTAGGTHESGLREGLSQGLDFSDTTALVTGASPDSIALDVVAQLLHGGARVIVTTTTYTKARRRFYRRLYQDHATPGAALHIVPMNQASRQDTEALIAWMLSTQTEQVGAQVKVIKRPMVPDLVLPFGAIKELGTLDQLGDSAEVAMRAMLLNVERLIAGLAQGIAQRGMPARPCHVILPLSPNHGAFGGDGAYAESKAGLEVLLQKWASERDAWGHAITLCGARIGWVRGTGLMQANNLVAPGLEERAGVRTFSTQEMACLIAGLCTVQARDAAAKAPLIADLTGRFGQVEDLKGVVAKLRHDLDARVARAARPPVLPRPPSFSRCMMSTRKRSAVSRVRKVAGRVRSSRCGASL